MAIKYVIGIDEVGRGSVAGPVVVCSSLILIKDEEFLKKELTGLRDSKKISEKKRENFFKKIQKLKKENKIFSAVSFVSNKDIDKYGINVAIKKALENSLNNLLKQVKKVNNNFNINHTKVLLDGGLLAPKKFKHQETIIKGDDKEFIISLSSVIAKIIRDRWMVQSSKEFPNYLLEKNKGYGTKVHIEAIKKHGLIKIHRKSFLKKYL